MVQALSGPRLPPARGAATHLVVLVHGYGADGNDLIGLAPLLQRLLPTASFVAPNAPERCQGSPMGYQWFPISRLDPQEIVRGVEGAAETLNAFLDGELERAKLPPERLALVGFSQGTMMSLHVGLSRAAKPAAIAGFSGALARSAALEAVREPPPILLVHGTEDPMIPAAALFDAAGALGAMDAAVQWHLSPGVGHSIDEAGIVLCGNFLRLAFGGQLARHGAVSCPIAS